jgi:3-oxoacyl-[acyl-carrier protein] reductase
MNILITGGASGLGAAITSKLASDSGDNIFFTFNRSSENAKAIEDKFPNVKKIKCDFQNQTDLGSILDVIENSDINVLINNAYTSAISPKHFHKTDISVFTDNFSANIIPVIRITQKAIIHFRKKKFGKIINILSSAILGNPPVGWSEYTAVKSYLASLSKSWAKENSSFNITSNSISPSFMQTNLNSYNDERMVENIKESHPFKQILTTYEVSEAVLFLSKCTQQINGINLIINAGTHVI